VEGATATADGSEASEKAERIEEPFEEDGRADVALDFVIDVLAAMGMDCTVDLLENEEDDPPEDIRLEIEGKDAGRVIGKKGLTLAALQFLANRVINRPGKSRRHVIIDAEGYRAAPRGHALLDGPAPRRAGRERGEDHHLRADEPAGPPRRPPGAREVPRRHHQERRRRRSPPRADHPVRR
jgi:spoIIIJ-associated protein